MLHRTGQFPFGQHNFNALWLGWQHQVFGPFGINAKELTYNNELSVVYDCCYHCLVSRVNSPAKHLIIGAVYFTHKCKNNVWLANRSLLTFFKWSLFCYFPCFFSTVVQLFRGYTRKERSNCQGSSFVWQFFLFTGLICSGDLEL